VKGVIEGKGESQKRGLQRTKRTKEKRGGGLAGWPRSFFLDQKMRRTREKGRHRECKRGLGKKRDRPKHCGPKGCRGTDGPGNRGGRRLVRTIEKKTSSSEWGIKMFQGHWRHGELSKVLATHKNSKRPSERGVGVDGGGFTVQAPQTDNAGGVENQPRGDGPTAPSGREGYHGTNGPLHGTRPQTKEGPGRKETQVLQGQEKGKGGGRSSSGSLWRGTKLAMGSAA